MDDLENKETTETVDAVINKIGKSPNFPMLVVATCAMSFAYVGSICTYMVQFTGFIPNEEYTCISQKCSDLRGSFTSKSGQLNRTFFNTETMCDNEMAHGVDFKWNLSRTTLAVDFDKICRKSEISLISSLFFVGGTFSLLFGTIVFEYFGRRKSSIIGGIICTIGTMLGLFCRSYNFMIAIRLLQGFGNFIANVGTYIWVLEFVPEQYRIYYNMWSSLLWVIGYVILVCVSYFIHNWHFIFLACSLVVSVTIIPIVLLPDSPRYLMSIGEVEEARRVLIMYSKLAKQSIDLSNVHLVIGESASKEDKMSTKARIVEIKEHKALLLETLVQWYYWFVTCLLFYFLNYGWESFGDTPYVNYLFAGLGEAIAAVILVPLVHYMGRRKAMVFSLVVACICFLLAMVPWQWTEVWSFERLMSLIAIVAVTCSFTLAFLYTNELAPTTHRGLVFSSCSLIARCSALTGTFVSEIFRSSIVKLGVNAALAGTAALLSLLLPETRNLPIPERAQDVSSRRKKQGLQNVC